VTTLQVAVEVNADGQISFFKKVCTEADKDKLTFYIDGLARGVWSGEIEWSQETFEVSAGQHTFKWIYMKDSSGSYGKDACWIDDIQFPAAAIVEILPGPELHATVDHNRVTLSWESMGAGYEYIIRREGEYLATQSATSFTEVHGDGVYLYSVTAKHQNQLSAPSYLLVEVGIADVEENGQGVSVYPNPTNGILFVETRFVASPQQTEYRVFNLTGQQIFSGKATGTLQIDFSGQPKGMYVLQVVDGDRVITKKIVVQ